MDPLAQSPNRSSVHASDDSLSQRKKAGNYHFSLTHLIFTPSEMFSSSSRNHLLSFKLSLICSRNHLLSFKLSLIVKIFYNIEGEQRNHLSS